MEMDVYEAAAFYDYSLCRDKKDTIFPRRMLIVDVDKYASCFCECTEKGNFNKVCEYSLPDGNDCMADMNKAFLQQTGKDDLLDVLGNHLDTFNSTMENYYRSDGQMDGSFQGLIGTEMKCSDIENVFKTPEERLNKLFSSLEKSWETSGFEEESTKIMLIGKSADLFPIRYLVKSYFSFDAFLADERYVNDAYDEKPSRICEIGNNLLEEKRKKQEEVYICVYDNISGEKVKQKLLLSNEGEDGVVEYFGPVFVSTKEGLEFEVDEEKKNIALPYSVDPLNCDVVDVGLRRKKDVVVINIRRFDFPTRVYEVPMGQ